MDHSHEQILPRSALQCGFHHHWMNEHHSHIHECICLLLFLHRKLSFLLQFLHKVPVQVSHSDRTCQYPDLLQNNTVPFHLRNPLWKQLLLQYLHKFYDLPNNGTAEWRSHHSLCPDQPAYMPVVLVFHFHYRKSHNCLYLHMCHLLQRTVVFLN